ncbi:UNVERIFIED_CONTAM: hypothetical protein Slati_0740200 [Sesamum latifolium]|uniref:Uncharacterized protein n=1 Tax=Sesamum latifolium TaxID=2727402 RepID=A0AAW2XJZ0_9LAMI
MEEKIQRLERENAQLREAKKEAANHRAQMDKELKRLSKVSAEHETALRRAVEKAWLIIPTRRRGGISWKLTGPAKWMSTRSLMISREVAQVAFPFVGYGFNACKEQFLTHRPPPAGEEFSFLDVQIAYANAPDPFAKPSASEKKILLRTQVSSSAFCFYSFFLVYCLCFTRSSWAEDLDSLLGEVEAEVKCQPLAAIDSSEGGVFGEGKTEEKKEDAPADLPEGPSNDPPAPAAMSESAPPLPTSLGPRTPKTRLWGENLMML